MRILERLYISKFCGRGDFDTDGGSCDECGFSAASLKVCTEIGCWGSKHGQMHS